MVLNNEVDNGLSDGVVTFSARIVITIIIHSLNVPIKRLPEDTYVLLVCVLLLLLKKKKKKRRKEQEKRRGQGSYCNQVILSGFNAFHFDQSKQDSYQQRLRAYQEIVQR